MSDLKGICSFANAPMARLLGSSVDAMVGQSVWNFVFAADRSVVRRHFDEMLRKPRGTRIQERLRRSDGTEVWTLVSGTAVRDAQGRAHSFLGMFTDITDKVYLEQALQEVQRTLELRVHERTDALAESEEKYRRLFETIPDAAFLMDGETSRFLEVNEAALKLYGYKRKEFLRLTYGALTAEPEASEAVRRLVLARGPQRVPLRRHRQKGGGIVPVELCASAFRLKGRILCCVVARDISRRLELEREILVISEQEKRRLGLDLHDDLCQQLAGIEFLSRGLASDLAETGSRGAVQAEEIAMMLQRAMGQTRDIARGLTPVRLEAQGLADALRELAADTGKMFRCECRFAGADSVALSNHAAAIHLYRIAQEAVNNAIKHGKARQIRVSLRLQGKDLGLVVADDGGGFAGDAAARNGMGLRIMRYRAEAIGGQLIVESGRKRGTRVRCCVPHAALLAEGKESANELGS